MYQGDSEWEEHFIGRLFNSNNNNSNKLPVTKKGISFLYGWWLLWLAVDGGGGFLAKRKVYILWPSVYWRSRIIIFNESVRLWL